MSSWECFGKNKKNRMILTSNFFLSKSTEKLKEKCIQVVETNLSKVQINYTCENIGKNLNSVLTFRFNPGVCWFDFNYKKMKFNKSCEFSEVGRKSPYPISYNCKEVEEK